MSFNESMQDRGRALEEEYFRRREQELIQKIRKAADEKRERDGLVEKTGLTDPALLAEVQDLGFTAETVNLLPLMPVLQVAWAEGAVTADERTQIFALARARGIAEGSAAHAQLLSWLETRPSAETFAKSARLISAVLAAHGAVASDLTAGDLVAYCEKVAAASGGVLGFGKVSSEEKALLTQIASALGGRG